jgi:hypothetical protein
MYVEHEAQVKAIMTTINKPSHLGSGNPAENSIYWIKKVIFITTTTMHLAFARSNYDISTYLGNSCSPTICLSLSWPQKSV